jgi:hypothetical protein
MSESKARRMFGDSKLVRDIERDRLIAAAPELLAAAEASAAMMEGMIRTMRETGVRNTWGEYDGLLDLRAAIAKARAEEDPRVSGEKETRESNAAECDEYCAEHAPDCDGFCDHPNHENQCVKGY